MLCDPCFFFFSSRRRHTRYIGDWSSDVCSSDLRLPGAKFWPDAALDPVACGPDVAGDAGRADHGPLQRSEERRVGKECRARKSTYRYKKNKQGKYHNKYRCIKRRSSAHERHVMT